MNRKKAPGEINIDRIEEGTEVLIDFEKMQKVGDSGELVVPVAVQDVESKEILLIVYVNETALQYTLKHRIAAFWSTSRKELWIKGATSGDKLEIVDILINCEQNSLVYLVRLLGEGSCHTKGTDGKARFGCYYRRIKDDKLEFMD